MFNDDFKIFIKKKTKHLTPNSTNELGIEWLLNIWSKRNLYYSIAVSLIFQR